MMGAEGDALHTGRAPNYRRSVWTGSGNNSLMLRHLSVEVLSVDFRGDLFVLTLQCISDIVIRLDFIYYCCLAFPKMI